MTVVREFVVAVPKVSWPSLSLATPSHSPGSEAGAEIVQCPSTVPTRAPDASYRPELNTKKSPGEGRWWQVKTLWFAYPHYQGGDAGLYSNDEIQAIRILVLEPTSDRRSGPKAGRLFRSHAMERMRADGVLNPVPIRQRWTEHLSGQRNWQYALWNVLMFREWQRRWA